MAESRSRAPQATAAHARREAAGPEIPTFRVGRKRVIVTVNEALQRWTVQQGILPRAEGGSQRPPAERLAGLSADPACAVPLSQLDPAALSSLRARRMAALGSLDAVLVEQAAMAAAIESLRELHGRHWPDPFAVPAPDGLHLIAPERLAEVRHRAGSPGDLQIDLALASCARFEELDGLGADALDAPGRCIRLPGRQVQLAPCLAARLKPCPGLVALGAALGLDEGSLRFTALTARLNGGSHLDEAFLLAGCKSAEMEQIPLVPWFG